MKIEPVQSLKVVLASRSPVRRRILDAAGVAFSVEPASVDETALLASWRGSVPLERQAVLLAEAKALEVGARWEDPAAAVIGADQILELDGAAYEAPSDRESAADRLRLLSGRRHRLITGVALVRDNAVLTSACEVVTVTMRKLHESELTVYLDAAGDEALSAVGGYALEGLGIRLIDRVEGDWFAALGLPLQRTLIMLRQIDQLQATHDLQVNDCDDDRDCG